MNLKKYLPKLLFNKSVEELISKAEVRAALLSVYRSELIGMALDDVAVPMVAVVLYPKEWPDELKILKMKMHRLAGKRMILTVLKNGYAKDELLLAAIGRLAQRSSDLLPFQEVCPHCEYEVGAFEHTGNCIICGHKLFVCNMCRRPDLEGNEGCHGDCSEKVDRFLLYKEGDNA